MAERLKKLQELEARLYDTMQFAEAKELPSLAKQYRETIKEIEEIEGEVPRGDAISKILTKRENDGKSGADRKGRARVPRK